MSTPHRRPLLGRLPLPERRFIADVLRQETAGGLLLLGAAALGLALANSSVQDWYHALQSTVVGPAALHLDLTLEAWAQDGLLALFFFVAGLELKRELVVGSLQNRAQAVLPVVAALGGMVVPALLFLAVAAGAEGAAQGWAVPMATDIAFALAVLAVAGSHLPAPLRAFLLTLAVIDDLGAIVVIAVAYTDSFRVVPFVADLALIGLYAFLQNRRVRAWWIYVPLALLVWYATHEAGIHATVAGVALGLLTRVRPDPGESDSPAERLEHLLRPLSAGVAVPVFAFLTAGVPFDAAAFRGVIHDVAAVGVVVGLVVGKFVGVLGSSWLTVRLTRAQLDPGLRWVDLAGLALLTGVGFTVSLLIAELAFADQPDRMDHVKAAVLIGSLVAAVVAMAALRLRDRAYRQLATDQGGFDLGSIEPR